VCSSLIEAAAYAGPAENHMQTDDQNNAARIGGAQPLAGGKIHLADYDPAWPTLFEREAERVRAVLGEQVRQIEHVGSTSVPGLMAKPIIDMLLAVPDSADEAGYVPLLERAGYVLRIREPDWFQHRLLKGPGMDINMHVFSEGCPEIQRMLLFRDWLRANPAERALYQRVKQELAQRNWKYTQNYADAKTSVVDEIIVRAGGTRRP
jgi:GrpB-like predicted nucleotidyltransferase (UPF0157 family)